MIELEELVRAELKRYIDENDDIKADMEAKLMKIISDLLRGDTPTPAKLKGIFDDVKVEV